MRIIQLPASVSHRWLVTGAAGFIGSSLIESLLRGGQEVVALDDFSTGHRRNLASVEALVGAEAWRRLRFIEGDIRDPQVCADACQDIEIVLHQAALGSVPRSIQDPLRTNAVNVGGTLNMLYAAHRAGVRRFVYAASSSTYGDHPALPKREDIIGRPLSPYAVSKYVNEVYAELFVRTYGLETIGLRYFNVFGPRQDPDGAYAAVIPRWTAQLLRGQPCFINGDGETTRDFCFVENVVQANMLAALSEDERLIGQVFNIAYGQRTSLNQLFTMIRDQLVDLVPDGERLADARPHYREFLPGDVRHSLADVSKARTLLGYEPTHSVQDGLAVTLPWYVRDQATAVTDRPAHL